jgi:hypothetical protein
MNAPRVWCWKQHFQKTCCMNSICSSALRTCHSLGSWQNWMSVFQRGSL